MTILVQHLSNNYRFVSQYSRVSICLDFELICAQQSQREAFSINELDESRYRLNHLLSCQQDLDDIWRSSRWLVDVINCAKDKSYSGISLKSWLTFQPSTSTSVHLKIISSDCSSSNYASDSALDTVQFSHSTLTLPTTITSTSLSSTCLNESSLLANYDSGFSDNDLNNHDKFLNNRTASISTSETNDPIELTVYIPMLTSNALIPFKIRTNKSSTIFDLLQNIFKQQQTLLKSILTSANSSSFSLVWIRSNNREQILEETLTVNQIERRLIRFGGQIHLRSKGLSISRSTQPLTKVQSSSRITTTATTPSTNLTTFNANLVNEPGSNLSLNIQ